MPSSPGPTLTGAFFAGLFPLDPTRPLPRAARRGGTNPSAGFRKEGITISDPRNL
jgi:hypothetical protein